MAQWDEQVPSSPSLSSSLRYLLSAGASALLPCCCLSRASRELLVGVRTDHGDPCWKQRGSSCRRVLLALAGTPESWGAKRVYPNVSRELGAPSLLPLCSPITMAAAASVTLSLGHRAWPRRIRSCGAPAGVSAPCAGLALLLGSAPFPRQAGLRSWLLGVGPLLS